MRRALNQLIVLAAAVALVVGVFAISSAPIGTAEASDPKPCLSKKFVYKDVEAACKEGGQKAAKKLMKSIVKKAKAAKDENATDCLGCHEDLKGFKRTKDAVKWLKPYVK